MPQKITAEILKKIFGEKLSWLREKSGETIEESAFSLGLDVSDYFKFLKGKRLPHLLTLMRISQKYGVAVGWWFGEVKSVPQNRAQIRQSTLENKISRAISTLDVKTQKAVLAMLKTLAKNLK
ncbi:MAG: helix-turn-helix domain-containing protein [Candidatus Margulisbacteria bacterium]|jgi:transcriptional regulator with XRE-family HTH domain|nr:helix-turn-helix domain-containing protein [Candidatus Margulisiibacteriota bacterium]